MAGKETVPTLPTRPQGKVRCLNLDLDLYTWYEANNLHMETNNKYYNIQLTQRWLIGFTSSWWQTSLWLQATLFACSCKKAWSQEDRLFSGKAVPFSGRQRWNCWTWYSMSTASTMTPGWNAPPQCTSLLDSAPDQKVENNLKKRASIILDLYSFICTGFSVSGIILHLTPWI